MICKYIIKRNGKKVDFNKEKLMDGLLAAVVKAGIEESESVASRAFKIIEEKLDSKGFDCTTAEQVQTLAVDALNQVGAGAAANSFMLYAHDRRTLRDLQYLHKTMRDLTSSYAKESDLKRENANIDADSAMGAMLKYGSESSKSYNLSEVIPEDIAEAHKCGDIHIHDMDFYTLTETCCQINLAKLFKGGFSTGHGNVREPGSIATAASLACIAIQSNQNDQHGGQSIPCFDYYMAPYVTKTCIKEIQRCFEDLLDEYEIPDKLTTVMQAVKGFAEEKSLLSLVDMTDLANQIVSLLNIASITSTKIMHIFERAQKYTDRDTYQAMEALVHNLNTMNSRAGAQVPFSSINFGTDISPEGRMVSQNLMQAVYSGLGNGETPVFPITIFKVKSGVNFEKDTPNYDLYLQALRTTATRLFPNFSFIDAPFNMQYYVPGHPETEVAYMGCRTRVMGNNYDSSREITEGRGNLSFTTINLPRLGILCKSDITEFYKLLDSKLELAKKQLMHRFKVQCSKTVRNYPFLMGQGVWIDSDKLYVDDTVEDVLKHGTLTIGFIGLAECLVAICGKHHGESETAQNLGLEIIGHMREFTDSLCETTGLNWSLIATPAEGLAGRFVTLDRKLFGELKGVTDKEWYTNSFHIPVEYKISFYNKLKLEGPYHALTNGGHISYVEVDGDVSRNIEAMDRIVHWMHDCGVGYGAINHPIDRDPVCGFTGIIDDECPLCNRSEGSMASESTLLQLKHYPEGHTFNAMERGECVKFDRIRRITGYLVGTIDRFNNAKRAELENRVKHL